MKNTKKLVLTLVSMLVITGFLLAGTVSIVSAGYPKGKITYLGYGTHSPTEEIIYFDTLNIGTGPGAIWSRVYLKTGSTWTQKYYKQATLYPNCEYDNTVIIGGLTPGVLYTFKVVVGHGAVIDHTITKTFMKLS